MTFDYELRHVDLFDLPDDCDGYGGYAMCLPHANRLRPPVGWTIADARDVALTLFPVAALSPGGAVAPLKPDSDVA